MITVGQVLYEKRRNGEVVKRTVEKVGRKYFYLEDGRNEGFDIETLKYTSDDSYSNRQLYLSEQAIEDEQRRLDLSSDIRRYFSRLGNSDLTLDQLERINNIINENH